MAKVNLTKAAKMVGKNRTTIWRHIRAGVLSSEKGADGLPTVDTSELIRAYGNITLDATPKSKTMQHEATRDISDLIEVINQLRNEQQEMKLQITNLTNRLTYNHIDDNSKERVENSKLEPESDPDWPREISSVADIALRQEIKEKYAKKNGT